MISVVIPALNERNGIVETIDRAKAALDGAQLTPYEIIIVDDGSADSTGELAEQAGAKVLRHPHNIGYGRSLRMEFALRPTTRSSSATRMAPTRWRRSRRWSRASTRGSTWSSAPGPGPTTASRG
ncbi:glycosyltransferase [Bradyrhizobium shewense]|uniref:glycosyltransferase n=1 Tax=Bradyrhizobium shewense TaxID=1761772 RepID=UPI001ABFCAD7